MSPPSPSRRAGMLEHPDEAFDAYRASRVTRLIAEEKHMGSRAVVVVTRDPGRFSAPGGWRGIVHTRTGRRFFPEQDEAAFLDAVHLAVSTAGLWDELATDWLVLDREILPWSLKAGTLIRQQYAAVGAAASASVPAAVQTLERASASGLDVSALLGRVRARERNAALYIDAYRRYVRRTDGLDGVQFAPFQVLASEGGVHAEREHDWHLAIADRLADALPSLFTRTARIPVDLDDTASVAAAVEWWNELTAGGGEGMVVKPAAGLIRNQRGLVQPGIKVRGREYLRIIYGPDYTEEHHLARLRDRNVGHKRSMALREYALGLEALHRFVDREPLWRVHQAVFAVLAMESEPVDPRL